MKSLIQYSGAIALVSLLVVYLPEMETRPVGIIVTLVTLAWLGLTELIYGDN